MPYDTAGGRSHDETRSLASGIWINSKVPRRDTEGAIAFRGATRTILR